MIYENLGNLNKKYFLKKQFLHMKLTTFNEGLFSNLSRKTNMLY